MAYVSQELKARIAPRVKEILNKYGLKGSLSVRHHSTLVLKVKSGTIDFIGNYNRIQGQRMAGMERVTPAKDHLSLNRHWFHEHLDGDALQAAKELFAALNDGNHDRSDIQTDYFDVGWYVDLDIGTWDKPYQLTA